MQQMSATTASRIGVLLVSLLAMALLLPGTALASNGLSGEGIQGTQWPGNFVASDDDQVCFELEALGFIDEVTTDMRGIKIDPPTDFSNAFIDVEIDASGKYLSWTAKNATVIAVIVKGGPNYHLYDYVGTGLSADTGLHSPLNKKNVPQISHYNVCYVPNPSGDGEGCTPGYWRNHADRWLGAAPGDDFDTTFGVDAFEPNITLGQAVQLGGGGVNALARHATAALLNAHGGVPNADGTTVDYPLTPDEVIGLVQDALGPDGDIEATKDALAELNEAGCPLSGTSAVQV